MKFIKLEKGGGIASPARVRNVTTPLRALPGRGGIENGKR